jgi:hypothetical protein
MEQQTFHGSYIWWRISDGSNPPGSYTIGSATNSAWVLAEFSGVDATPFDISNGTFTQTNTGPTTQATPSIVPTTGNRVLCAAVNASNTASMTAYAPSWNNSFTAIDSTGTAAGGTDDGCALSYRLVTGNGSTGYTTTGSIAQSSQSRSGLIISFKEGAAAGTTLTAAGGSYALTGTSAGIGGKAVANAGSYTLTGTAATFAFKLTAEAAVASEGVTDGSTVNFVITGAPVTLTALGGSYTLTGTAAGVGGRAIVDPGSYTLTGTAMTWRMTAPVAAGAYTLTGTAATFLDRMIAGNSGYTVNGTDATFLITSGDYTLFCGSGSYAITGRDAAFPGNEPIPPVQPSTGGGYTGGAVYDTFRLRKKRKRDEIEELIDAIQAPPPSSTSPTSPISPPPALVDLLPKMEAAGLTPPQRKIVKRAIVSDDEDDDDEAIEILLNLLS